MTATVKDLGWLCRQLKAPSLSAVVERLGARAREEGWSHAEFLAACLETDLDEIVTLARDFLGRVHA